MLNKKIIIPAFFLMVLIQLYVPFRMILSKEDVLAGGKEFKFRSRSIDPNDPFRGKYITLSFEKTSLKVTGAQNWNKGDQIYVFLTEDEKGFAKIDSITKEMPQDQEDYVKATIGYIIPDTLSYISVDYPFTRYYMEESLAEGAAQAYWDAARDSNQVAYALVSVKDGDAVIRDVLINGTPLREIARSNKGKVNQ